jgi:hypothetical protein
MMIRTMGTGWDFGHTYPPDEFCRGQAMCERWFRESRSTPFQQFGNPMCTEMRPVEQFGGAVNLPVELFEQP